VPDSGTAILPFDKALEAIAQATKNGQRLINWEGWVQMRDGTRAKSLSHGGSFALPRDATRAAETATAGMRRALETWRRNPEYPGAELHFGLTFSPVEPAT
jgi:hypothetical protein